ncbi:MAG: hypothetical protein A2W23_07865 [Planctomycetes bacterium RBG_16_43_13]|nr:MAG: hypothetical protein A2W23_07865 [Planctomycetes bacterium RBG_16_43_13]
MLLRSVGVEEIRRIPPFNTGFPPAPTDVRLDYKDGIATVTWRDPIVKVGDVTPTLAKVRIWVAFSSTEMAIKRAILAVVDVPSAGEYTFDRVRMSKRDKGVVGEVLLAEIRSGALRVQLDTVVSYGEGVGAVRSVGSNTERKGIETS